MQLITREEKEWLIKHKYLKMQQGRYPDLAITGKCKTGRRKRYYVPDYIAAKLKFRKLQK